MGVGGVEGGSIVGGFRLAAVWLFPGLLSSAAVFASELMILLASRLPFLTMPAIVLVMAHWSVTVCVRSAVSSVFLGVLLCGRCFLLMFVACLMSRPV